MRFLRRLRGAAITSLLWAVAWGSAGAIAYAVLEIRRVFRQGSPFSFEDVLPHMVIGAVFLALYGFLSGAAFSTVLALLERRRKLEDLSIRRVTAWGALGGMGVLVLNLVLMLLFEDGPMPGDAVPVLIIMGILGAGCAAGSLALARRAPGQVVTGGTLPLRGDALSGTRIEDSIPARSERAASPGVAAPRA